MSYEENDNEFSNGGAGRFDGVAERYKPGGNPRRVDPSREEDLRAALATIGDFFRNVGRDTSLMDLDGDYKADLTKVPTLEVVREFKATKDFKEACDILAKEANRAYDYLRLAAVPERFEEEGISNIKVDGVGRVQLAGDIYAGIIRGSEEKAFEWLGDNGRGDLIKRTVNSSSIKAVLKKMISDGEEVPATLFKAEPFTRASIVKV
ncbi:MAG: hypothetical protein DDT26_00004 [Dehalococcoidia bacterium]|nr:hypothetical protein [Chloroflexota bacterium]